MPEVDQLSQALLIILRLQVRLDVLRCQASIVHAIVNQLVFGERRIVGDLQLVVDHVIHFAVSSPLLLEMTTWDSRKVSFHRDKGLDLGCRPVTLIST